MSREVKWPHPGEILMEEWLVPMGLSQYALAKAIDVPPRRINEIVKGLRGITADTALEFRLLHPYSRMPVSKALLRLSRKISPPT